MSKKKTSDDRFREKFMSPVSFTKITKEELQKIQAEREKNKRDKKAL
ncbi:hypothetical protein [Olivibacter sitiensis]|nr:hypothetical protein [Olivibacter sitiensis]